MTRAKPEADRRNPPRTGKIAAVEHAIAVLRCVSEADGPIGVNDIARRVGLHKSSVSRLVATLAASAFVRREPETGRISLGMGLVAVATPAFAQFNLRDVVRPLLATLAMEVDETVSFSIWDCSEAVSIEQVPGANAVQAFSEPGHRNPGHATAAGKILLAHLGEDAITEYCSRELRRYTAKTITQVDALKEELQLCRSQGFAINRGEFEIDVGAVSALVRDRQSNVAGGISIIVPMYRFGTARRSELAKTAMHFARKLSSEFGYSSADRKEAMPASHQAAGPNRAMRS